MAKKNKIVARKITKPGIKLRKNNNIELRKIKRKKKTTEMTFGEGLIAGAQEILEYHQGDTSKIADIRTVEIKPVLEIKPSEIVKIRKKLHLSQTMLAEILNVSYRTVEAWEHGKNKPSGGSARLLSMMKEDDELIENYGLIKQI